MNLIIFSKDRPLQLACTLQSVKDQCDIFDNIYVQYSTIFPDSYSILSKEFPDVIFVDEKVKFKETFIDIPKSERVCLMVDDDIVFRPVTEIPLVPIFSLRLGYNIKHKVHFDYNSSLDGNVFGSGIIEKVYSENFTNPNKLEVALIKHTTKYKMKHFSESRLVGIPNNRVSDTSGCSYMEDNIQELNQLFLDGKRIDYKNMNLECDNVHKYVEYQLKDTH